jgi:hypothetical protein
MSDQTPQYFFTAHLINFYVRLNASSEPYSDVEQIVRYSLLKWGGKDDAILD